MLAVALAKRAIASLCAKAMATKRADVRPFPSNPPVTTTVPAPMKTNSNVAMNSANVARHISGVKVSSFPSALNHSSIQILKTLKQQNIVPNFTGYPDLYVIDAYYDVNTLDDCSGGQLGNF